MYIQNNTRAQLSSGEEACDGAASIQDNGNRGTIKGAKELKKGSFCSIEKTLLADFT